MTLPPLSILVVEDQALVAMELECIIEDAGHVAAGWATSYQEALDLVASMPQAPDLAFVDVNLGKGPSGLEVAEHLLERAIKVVFMTANAKRVAADMHGAIGIMAKPYSSGAVIAALTYLQDGVHAPPPERSLPAGLMLSPRYARDWSGACSEGDGSRPN